MSGSKLIGNEVVSLQLNFKHILVMSAKNLEPEEKPRHEWDNLFSRADRRRLGSVVVPGNEVTT